MSVAVAQKTKTSNAVTLKGSSQMVAEFFNYGINSILYQRGVYAPETFTRLVPLLNHAISIVFF